MNIALQPKGVTRARLKEEVWAKVDWALQEGPGSRVEFIVMENGKVDMVKTDRDRYQVT